MSVSCKGQRRTVIGVSKVVVIVVVVTVAVVVVDTIVLVTFFKILQQHSWQKST